MPRDAHLKRDSLPWLLMNLALAAWTLCPVPALDGWMLWRTLAGGAPRA